MLDRSARLFLAGHRGMVGSALLRLLIADGFSNVLTELHEDLDLTDGRAAHRWFNEHRPRYVIMCAGRVGGIGANSEAHASFCLDNLAMNLNVVRACHDFDVDKLMLLGSSCIYPRECRQPMRETDLMTGPLEPTNEGYAVAKIAALKLAEAFHRQFGHNYVGAMPTNLYGPRDNFNLKTSHVLPAMLRRLHEAATTGADKVVFWGSGRVMREFLHVSDAARAILVMMDAFDAGGPAGTFLNVGSGKEIELQDLARLIADVVDFKGEILWDHSGLDGMPRKLLDSSWLRSLGWAPTIDLEDGIRQTHAWLKQRGWGRLDGGALD